MLFVIARWIDAYHWSIYSISCSYITDADHQYNPAQSEYSNAHRFRLAWKTSVEPVVKPNHRHRCNEPPESEWRKQCCGDYVCLSHGPITNTVYILIHLTVLIDGKFSIYCPYSMQRFSTYCDIKGKKWKTIPIILHLLIEGDMEL